MTGRAGRLAVLLAALAGGCGLSMDLGPAQGGAGLDASVTDAASRDGGAPDAGPRECTTDPDCDDHDACTGAERCVEGTCEPGERIECPDDDPCDGVSTCVEGECRELSPPSCADDGDECNGRERCVEGIGCASEEPLRCDDGIDCTVDACDAGTGCSNVPDASRCTAATGGSCDATDGCQYETCTEATCASDGCWSARCEMGVCRRETRCDGSETCCAGTCVPAGCDDGNRCTDDSCDPAGGCQNVANAAACNDGNPCTAVDACSDGSCVGAGAVACGDGDPCTADACSPTAGCVHGPAADGTPCNDGDACTAADRCRSGSCAGLAVSSTHCDDGNVCTTDSCDSATGCRHVVRTGSLFSCALNAICDGAGACVCSLGFADCDGDGTCECASPSACGASRCVALVPGGCATGTLVCTAGSVCCLDVGNLTWYGRCGDPSCMGCCPVGT